MLKRLENTITEEDMRRGKTLRSIGDIWDHSELSMFLPNMANVLNFQTYNGGEVSFYISSSELLSLATTDFYEITKDMALQAQKNTIAAAMEDPRTSMSDYLDWLTATDNLEAALKEEKTIIAAQLGK